MNGVGVGSGAGDAAENGAPADGPVGAEQVLERRYRRLLMVLPRAYRADRGEEMLTALMDSAPRQRRWPKLGEVLSLATHGLKVRSGLSAERMPSGAAHPLLRTVALLGTLYLSFLSALGPAMGLRWDWGIYQSDVNHSDLDGHHHQFAEIVLVQAAGLLWLAAHVALLLGRRRLVLALGLALLVVTATQVTGGYTTLAAVPPLTVAGSLIATGRRPIEPAPRGQGWFAALTAVAIIGYSELPKPGVHGSPATIGSLAAVAVAVVVAGALRAWRRSEWALAAAVVGGMASAQRALESNHYPDWRGGFDPQLRLVLVGEAVLVLVALYAIIRQRRPGVATEPGNAA